MVPNRLHHVLQAGLKHHHKRPGAPIESPAEAMDMVREHKDQFDRAQVQELKRIAEERNNSLFQTEMRQAKANHASKMDRDKVEKLALFPFPENQQMVIVFNYSMKVKVHMTAPMGQDMDFDMDFSAGYSMVVTLYNVNTSRRTISVFMDNQPTGTYEMTFSLNLFDDGTLSAEKAPQRMLSGVSQPRAQSEPPPVSNAERLRQAQLKRAPAGYDPSKYRANQPRTERKFYRPYGYDNYPGPDSMYTRDQYYGGPY